jgi:hypothetical protein
VLVPAAPPKPNPVDVPVVPKPEIINE